MSKSVTPAAVTLFALLALIRPVAAQDFENLRADMVQIIDAEARIVGPYTGRGQIDPRVLEVMRRVPRHAFVPPQLTPYAYLNRPLPVGHGQTVSQPFIVALMTDLAGIRPGDQVLLVGIGGGYHAAILSEIAGAIRCVDMQAEVVEAALGRLKRLGYNRVNARTGDPYFGWPENGVRFDAIIVRQAMDYVPNTLLTQLKPGGRLVLPAGRSDEAQHLTLATRRPDGRVIETRVLPVRFTRMPGGSRI